MRAIDLRGHGQSPAATSPLTLDDLAADVAADVLGHCRIQMTNGGEATREPGVVLVGASLGGVVALRVAARLGNRVRALVLAATDPCPETDGSRARRRATLDLADRLGARSVFRALAPSMFGRTTRRDRPVLVSRWLAGVLEIDPRSVRPVVEAALSRDDLRPLLPEIRCPVLVLAGAEDEIASVGASDALVHGLPSSRRVIVREAGHSLHLEQPLQVANLVSELLRELT